MAVGSFQGSRIADLRDSEIFYRWLVNASTQVRLGDSLVFDTSPDLPEPMDDRLFEDIAAVAERLLPELPIDGEEDYDEDGVLFPRLVRAARLGEDDAVWDLASDDETAELKADFIAYLGKGQIQSAGTQFTAAALYSGEDQVYGVGVSSMFLGFRTVAAGFVWQQVDRYWHEGQMHRMVPLMRTCVTLDPTFIDAYLLGSWHLGYNITAKLLNTPEPQKKWNEKYQQRLGYKEEWYYIAIDFLKDGIRKNPREYRLYFDLGYALYENKLNDHANAVKYLDEARRHRHDRWVPRMLYLAMMRNGQHEEAIEGWMDYMIDFPDNLSGPRFIQINKGYVAEKRLGEALACGKAAREAVEEARRLAAEARADGNETLALEQEDAARKADVAAQEMDVLVEIERATAVSIWTPLAEGQHDPLAESRLLRLKAMDYIEEERYLEAISELEVARWADSNFFVEASNMMIDIKNKAGIDLSVSEKLSVQRDADAAQYRTEPKTPPKRRIRCDYLPEAGQSPTS